MLELILLEDEPMIAEELAEYLCDCGYRVTLVRDIAAFTKAFDAKRHSLALIDLGLPDGDGLDLIHGLRQQGSTLGIVAFTARAAIEQKVLGLRIGADHYLTKGCDLDELAAVINALVRRLGLQGETQPWRLATGPRELWAPNQRMLRLSNQDTLVLQPLMSSAGCNVSRRKIVEALGEDWLSYDQRRLDTQMRRLRRKVEQATGLELPLKTLRNNGYCFYERVTIID